MWPGCPPRLRLRRQGLTLVEVLISLGLLGLVMAGVYASLVLSMRYQAKLSDSVETFRRALLASTKMTQALGTGAQSSLVIAPEGFAFASAQPAEGPFTHDAQGRIEWHRFVFFYTENGDLYRGEVPLTPPTVAVPTPPGLAALKADARATRILVARRVELLKMEVGSGATTQIRVQGESPETNAVTLESRVTFRQ